MAFVNKVILIGNLTRDPEVTILPNQTAVANFGLAMNRKWKSDSGEDREEVTFVDVAAFGRQADAIKKYVQKGHRVYVEGRLKFEQWEDKNGGGKRSKLSVVCDSCQFLQGRDMGAGDDRNDEFPV